jgi:methionyl-tRNA formyltransferase
MAMAEGLDTGDMLLESRTLIGENETAGELYQRLSTMGASLAVETLATLSEIRPRPQEHSAHTLAPLIDRSLAEIDWTQDAQTIHNLIRGFHPWPTAWTTLAGERLKVHSSRVVDASGSAGTIIKADKTVVVAAAQGGIALNMVQLAGKRAQPGRDLVNSGRIKEGMTLGQEA